MSNTTTLNVINFNAIPTLSDETLGKYYSVIRNIPILSIEEEYELMYDFKTNGSTSAAHKLVVSNLRFVAHIARGFKHYSLSMADLIQEGNIGLMQAIHKFDLDIGQNMKLVSFAVHWIKSYMYDYIVRNWSIIRIATTKAQRKLFFNLRKYKQHLENVSPDVAHTIADDLNVKLSDVYDMEKRLGIYMYSIEPIAEYDEYDEYQFNPGNNLIQRDADPAIRIERDQLKVNNERTLRHAIHLLDDRSADIIQQRWLSEVPTTMLVLSKKYKVSIERIRQLEQNAIKKMKTAFTLEA